MYVDANGQVHDGDEGDRLSAISHAGHRLSGDGSLQDRLERAASNVENAALGGFEITVPTTVKVAVGVVAVGVVALPVGALVLSYFAARKAARVAAAAAPYVAEAAPVIMAAVPEAAPVVAAAGVLDAVRKVRAGQPVPEGTGAHLGRLVGSLRTLPPESARVGAGPTKPSATMPEAPASALPSHVAPEDPAALTTRDPSRSYAGQLLGALRTIAPEPKGVRVEVDGVPVRAELVKPKEQDA